eukprot:136444_1
MSISNINQTNHASGMYQSAFTYHKAATKTRQIKIKHYYMLHYLVGNKINILIIYLFLYYKRLQDYVMLKKHWIIMCDYYRKGMIIIDYFCFHCCEKDGICIETCIGIFLEMLNG